MKIESQFKMILNNTKIQLTFILLLTFNFCLAQSIVGKWCNTKYGDDSKIWFRENQDIFIYMPEDKMWVRGKYESDDKVISIKINLDGESIESTGSYELISGFLLLTTDGYIDKMERKHFPDPEISKQKASEKVIKKERSLTQGFTDSLIVSENEIFKFEQRIDEAEIEFKYLYIGRNGKLILPKEQYALKIIVHDFVAESGSQIIGKGGIGSSINLETRMKMRHSSNVQAILHSGYDCLHGLNGDNGVNGVDGLAGCNLTLEVTHLKVHNLLVILDGGNGQDGQDGQNGGNGGPGTCSCSGGNGGSPGLGGYGGNGGKGGNFKLGTDRFLRCSGIIKFPIISLASC